VLISDAFAQATQTAPQGMDIQMIVMFGGLFAVMYFLMIRPQAKRAKEHKAMLAALQKGDEVVMAGGVLGKVTKVGDNYVSVEVAPSVEIQVQKPSVTMVLPKGTLKNVS
jgi:preprotein translocase subunit YajC